MRGHPLVWRLLGAAALGVLLAGCVGKSPRVAYYNLSPVVTPAPMPLASAPAIAVGPADLPRALNRSQIATRLGPNQVEYDEFHRWAGSLTADFLSVAASNLGRLLATDRVIVYPAPPAFDIDYRVLFDVVRFEADADGDVTLEARWILQSGEGETLDVGSVRAVEPAAPEDYAARAAAHSAAVGAVCQEVAGRIRTLAETR